MIAIIRWTLRQRRYYLLWWSVGIMAFVAVLMAVYPSIRDQAEQLNQTLSQLPEAIRSLKSNNEDLLSPTGFLNSQLYYATLPLLFSMISISLGSNLLGRDEQDKTLELLLARPVSRTKVLFAKGISALLILGGITLATAASILVFGSFVDLSVDAGRVLLATFACALLAATFGAVAFVLTAAARIGKRASIGIAALFGLASYLLTSLAGVSDWIEQPSKLLPYHYFNPYDILNGQVSGVLVTYCLAVIATASVVSWLTFRRRDID